MQLSGNHRVILYVALAVIGVGAYILLSYFVIGKMLKSDRQTPPPQTYTPEIQPTLAVQPRTTVAQPPRNSEKTVSVPTMVIPTATPVQPTATPVVIPTVPPKQGSGNFACSPEGTCNSYGGPALGTCPVTFADSQCQQQCGDPAKRCKM
jgi:hypothetical protein